MDRTLKIRSEAQCLLGLECADVLLCIRCIAYDKQYLSSGWDSFLYFLTFGYYIDYAASQVVMNHSGKNLIT